MKPYNPGGHAYYQERALSRLRKYYPDAASSLPSSTWDIMEKSPVPAPLLLHGGRIAELAFNITKVLFNK